MTKTIRFNYIQFSQASITRNTTLDKHFLAWILVRVKAMTENQPKRFPSRDFHRFPVIIWLVTTFIDFDFYVLTLKKTLQDPGWYTRNCRDVSLKG